MRSTKRRQTCSTASAPSGTRCANCHGPDGDVIAGIDLGRGQFRRPLTDDDLVRIIRTGIPNTPMPASPMTVEQAQKIVAYLRARAAAARGSVVAGDAARGKAAFDGKGGLHLVPPRRRTPARASAPTSPASAAGAAPPSSSVPSSTRAPTSPRPTAPTASCCRTARR